MEIIIDTNESMFRMFLMMSLMFTGLIIVTFITEDLRIKFITFVIGLPMWLIVLFITSSQVKQND